MASRSQHEAYRCPICLYSFRVPVSIPCGHTYCKACIELFWDSADRSAGFSCPECRKTFWRKPELNKNVSISSALDGTTRPGSPGDWERSSPAVATSDGPELTGTGRETSTTDEATESLARSKQLASIKQTLTQREEETAVLVSHLESTDPKLQAAAEETKSRLRRGCDELTLAIREESESALRAVDAERDARLSELRQQLRERREALRGLREALGGIASLEALREPAEFLQSCNLHCDSWASLGRERPEPPADPRPDFSAAESLRRRIDELLGSFATLGRRAGPAATEDAAKETRADPSRGDAAAPRGDPAALGACGGPASCLDGLGRADVVREYGCSPTLNPDSSNRHLRVSRDGKTASRSLQPHRDRDRDEAFRSCTQVLCREGLSCGRRYWEVCTGQAKWCRVGAAYDAIPRAGDASWLGENAASWCLEVDERRVAAMHGGERHPVETRSSSVQRVGLFLDWEAGTLSFYHADTMRLLYSFSHRFTEPLLPALGLYDGGRLVIIP